MQFLFLDSTPKSSRKDHELRDSTARSHAAKFSHRRAKGLKSPASGPTEFASKLTRPIDPDVFNAVGNVQDTSLEPYSSDDNDTAFGAHSGTEQSLSPAGIMTMITPRSILMRGQSDPFDTLPVQVDSEMHAFITYWKSHFLLHRHGVNAKTWTRNQGAMADWQEMRSQMEDSGIGYAALAQISAALTLTTPSKRLVESALTYYHRSVTALRKRLQSSEDLDDWENPTVWRHIAMLQNVELYIRNRDGAVVHGKMLRSLFDRFVTHGKTVDPRLLLHALYVDVHMAVIFLVRPNFKPSVKLIDQFPELSSAILVEVLNVSNFSARLDDQVKSKTLRDIFGSWEQWPRISSFYSRRLWTFITQLRTVNHLLDMEEKLKLSRLLNSCDEITFFTAQAYISLAALYFIRVSTLPEHFASSPHFSAHTALLTRLRYHLEVCDVVDDKHIYSRAKLWALFVGALSEHQAARLKQSYLASRGWFNAHLVQHAKRCGLSNWTDVREVLEGFMYCEVVPDPSEWYTESKLWGQVEDLS